MKLDKTRILYNEPQLLPDGVLVTQHGETQRHVATWNILITLDTPQEEPGLRDNLRRFRQIIRSLHQQRNSLNVTKHLWEGRIQEIEDTMLGFVPGTAARTRRGLLNLIGEVSQKLFGTATEAQVDKCRKLIARLEVHDKRITHSYHDLFTLVNQTHDQIKENRQHIRTIETFISNITNELSYIADVNQKQQEFVEFIDSEIRIDQLLSAIEATHHHWLRQVDKYRRQKASLELGWLTEEILPPNELVQIIRGGRRAGFRAPPVPWYYEHITIQPFWEDPSRLVFQAELLFTDDVRYLRYQISTWPIPGNSTDADVMLQLPNEIALNTENGDLFEPANCRGQRPAICRTGPIYDQTRFPCARGILTNGDALRTKCKVTITKTDGRETKIHEPSEGVFIIRTSGETCSLHCSGKPEGRIQLARGVHVIRPSMNCQIRGRGWTINSIVQGSARSEVAVDVLEVPSLALLNLTTTTVIKRPLTQPTWEVLGEIKDITIDDFDEENDPTITWGSHAGHFSWITFIFVIISVIIVCFITALHKLGILAWPCKFKPGKDIADPAVPMDNVSAPCLPTEDRDPIQSASRTAPQHCPGMPQAWQFVTISENEDPRDITPMEH